MKTKMNLRWRWLLGLSLMLCWLGGSGPNAVQAQESVRMAADKMVVPAAAQQSVMAGMKAMVAPTPETPAVAPATAPGKVVASVPTADLPTVKVAQYRRGRKSAQTDTVRFTVVWTANPEQVYPMQMMLAGEGEGVIDWGDGTRSSCSAAKTKDGTDYEFADYEHCYTEAAENGEYEVTVYTSSPDLQIVGLSLYSYTNYDVYTLHSGVDVRFCPSLKYLYCGGNWLGALDLTNAALEELGVARCRLTSLTLPESAALKKLACGGNQLTSLDVSGCTALTELYCWSNQLTSLDVSACTALTGLHCYRNQLTSLNLPQTETLKELSAGGNRLTSLDVSGYPALRQLYCWGNQLTELDLSQNTVLDTLECTSNQLGWATLDALSELGCRYLLIAPQELSFEVGLNEAVDLSAYMAYNGQQTVCDFSAMPASAYTFENGVLKINRAGAFTVSMSNPAVNRNGESLPINCNVSVGSGVSDTVRWVWQQNGGIDYVNLTIAGNATSITMDWGDGTIETEAVESNGFRQIRHIYAAAGKYAVKIWGDDQWMLSGLELFSQSHVQSLDLSDCPYLESLICYGNDLTALDLSACVSLKSLNCYQNQLSSLNVSGCMALTRLYCNGNQLTSLDVTKNVNLTDLNCSDNQLTSLDVTKNVNLISLNCYQNQLSSLNVMQNTALTYLSCAYTQLDVLDVTKNVNLKQLYCNDNQLSSLNLTQNTDLEFLECGYNPLTTLDLTQNTALTELSCYSCQLSSLNVMQNTALEKLACGNNLLTALDLTQNTALKQLYCNNNQLSSLDLTQNTDLEHLECGNNQLTELDLTQNTILQQLWCSYNQLTSLDVSQNVHLRKVVCPENRLTSLNTGEHTLFETLSCQYNQLGWAALDALSGLGGNIHLTPQRLPSLEVELNEAVDLSEYAAYNDNETEFEITPASGYTLNNGILSLQRAGSYNVSMSNPGVAWHEEPVIIECRLTAWPGASDTLRWVWAVRDTAASTFDIYAEGDSSFIVKWGDSQQDTVKMSGQVTSGIVKHSYAEFGEYAVTVYGLKHFMPLGLDLSNMNVQSLDVHACSSLETLQCGGNQLTELDLSKNKVLSYLSCEGNQLTSLDVSQNTALTIVNCFYNQLGWADLDALSELEGSISPQQLSFEVDLNEEVDLSGYMTYNGQQTEFDFSNISASAYTFTDGKLQFRRPGTYVFPMSNPAVKTKDGTSLLIQCGFSAWPAVPDTVRWVWQQQNDANVYVNLDMKHDEGFMIDWGDGTVEKSESWYQINHTYADAGEYAVTVYGVNRWVLFGLEFFGGGSFQSLDVSACPYLESLSCYNKGLTSLDVSKNTALKTLNCSANQLTELDLSKNTALETLQCGGNQLTELDLSNNTALTSLNCSDNGLTSLDVSKNTALTFLNCFYNPLTSLDLSNNTALKTLDCSANQLTKLDLSENTALEDLICYHNQLTELDLSNNTALKTLNCSGNQLTSLDLTQNTALETWDASYNIRILVLDEDRAYDLSTLPGMDVSRISNVEGGIWENPKMFFNWQNVIYDYETGRGTVQFNLEEAIIRDTVYMTWTAEAGQEKSLTVGIGAEGGNNHAIYWADFGDGEQAYVNVYGPATLSHTYKASGTYNVKVSLDWDGRIKLFNCDGFSRRTGNGVTFLDVSACTELETLSCNNNNLTALDLSQNKALTSLSYNNNPSLDLDVSQLSDLMELYCADNQLTALDLSQNTTLKSLYCYNNQLSSLDVSSNRLLKTLSCSNNRLTSLNLAQNTRLEELYCDNNQLTVLDLSKNTSLKEMSCNKNQLTSLDVTANGSLSAISCDDNYRIVSLDANRRFDLGTLPGMDVTRVRKVTGGELEGSQLTFKAGVEKVTYEYKTGENYYGRYATFSIGTSPLTPENPGTTPRDTIFMTLGSSGTINIGVGADDSWLDKNITHFFLDDQMPNTVWVDWGDGTRSYYNPLTATLKAGTKIEMIDGETGEQLDPIEIEEDMEIDEQAYIGVKKGAREIMISVTDPAIHLTFLNASYVGMTSLEIDGCPSLQTLSCSSNALKVLDLTRNQMLKNLDCGNNQLKSLDLSACSALTELNCDNSQLTSLDVSGCPVLKKLGCSSNSSLSSLMVSGCLTLEELNCGYCALESLDVSGCSALETLSCPNNSLTALDVSGCLALKTLRCNNNRLMALEVSNNAALTTLYCSGNRLTELVLTSNFDLRRLECSNNQLTSLDLSKNYDLSYLYCRDNSRMVVLGANRGFDLSTLPGMDASRVSDVWGATKAGSRLYFENDATEVTYNYNTKYVGDGNYKTVEFRLTAAPVYNDTVYLTWTAEAGAAKTLQVGIVADENWTFEEGETTFGVDWGDGTHLYAMTQEDTSFAKTYATAGTYAVKVWGHSPVRLGSFGCSGNGITALDVSACTELVSLNCANNQLVTLDLSGNMKLKTLYCNDNRLENLDLGYYYVEALETLYCQNNRLPFSVIAALPVLGYEVERCLSPQCDFYDTISIEEGFPMPEPAMVNGTATEIEVYNTANWSALFENNGYTIHDGRLYFDEAGTYHLVVSNGAIYSFYDSKWEAYSESTYITITDENVPDPVDGNDLAVWTWTKEGNGTLETSVLFAGTPGGTFVIDWGDGERVRVTATGESVNYTHTYGTAGPVEWQLYATTPASRILKLQKVSEVGLANETLNVRGCPELTYLAWVGCENCGGGLTALDVSQNLKLEQLYCYYNQLTALDVTRNTALKAFSCEENLLTSVGMPQGVTLDAVYFGGNRIPFTALTNIRATQKFLWPQSLSDTIDVETGITLPMVNGTPVNVEVWRGNELLTANEGYTVRLDSIFFKLYFAQAGDYRLIQWHDAFLENFLQTSPFGDLAIYERIYHDTTAVTVTGKLPDTVTPGPGPADNYDLAVWTWTKEGNGALETNVSFAGTEGGSFVIDWGDGVKEAVEGTGERVKYTHIYDMTAQGGPADTVFSFGRAGQVEWQLYATTPASRILELVKNVEVGLDNETLDVSGCPELTILAWVGCEDCDGGLTALDVSQNLKLEKLSCHINRLTSLDVTKNTLLTSLSCSFNPLTSLDLTKNAKLEGLWCYDNRLTALDVTQNTALTLLSCGDNQLTSLDVTKNTALESLYCYENQLTSLDVTKNTALTSLSCHENRLTSLDVTKNTLLTSLSCSYNPLTSLDLTKNTKLESLWCYDNRLAALDVTKNTALTLLSCGGNQLTSLDVTQNLMLETLYCYSNLLTSLDLSQNTALMFLSCSYNQLTSLDISDCMALARLYCYDNQLESLDVSQNTALELLNCGQNQLTALDVSKNTKLETLLCEANAMPLSVLATFKDMEETCFSPQQIACETQPGKVLDLRSEMRIGATQTVYTVLKDGKPVDSTAYTMNADGVYGQLRFKTPGQYRLTLSNAEVTESYTALDSGYYNHNEKPQPVYVYYDISVDQPIVQGSGAGWMWLASAGAEKRVTFKGSAEGFRIDWGDENSSDVESGVATHRYAEGGIYTVKIESLSKEGRLTSLDVSNGNVAMIWFEDASKLTALNCADNQLTSVDLSAMPNLKDYNCARNQFTSLDLKASAQLQTVDFSGNQLTGVSLPTHSNLKSVKGADNRMKLSTLYGLLSQRVEKASYSFDPQGDSVYVSFGAVLDLSAEMNIGGNKTTYVVSDAEGRPVQASEYVETNGSFRFTEAGHRYKVTLMNMSVMEYQNGNPQKPVTFVLNVIVPGVGNEELTGSDACVYVRNRTICLSEDLGEMRVYTTLGRCIYKGNGLEAEVPCAGLYVVQAGGHTWKVVVR